MIRLVFLILFMSLTACQTSSTFFHPEAELIDWGLQKQTKALNEPSLFAIKGSKRDQFRLIVFSGVTPIHSIRLQVPKSQTARMTLTRLTSGYRLARRPVFDSQTTKLVARAKIDGFLKQLKKQDFLNLESSRIDGGEVCMHPTIFHFESLKDGTYHDYTMSVCSLSIEGVAMLKVFYELAGIDSSDEWSLSEYFSETWKRPEYQDLLAVD